VSLVT